MRATSSPLGLGSTPTIGKLLIGAIAWMIKLTVSRALSRETALYPEPESFNPARWLEPGYPTYKEPLSQHPSIRNMFVFGYGRRTCMGQDVVEIELIVGLGNLAWSCNIGKKVDRHGRAMEIPLEHIGADYTPQLISRPKPFPFELVPRSGKKAAQVNENWVRFKAARELDAAA